MMINQKISGSFVFAMVFFHGLESSYAFQISRQAIVPTKLFAEDPFGGFDLDLAEDLANNFGKYSVDEIETCLDGTKNRELFLMHGMELPECLISFSLLFCNLPFCFFVELHARRVQHVAFQDDVNSPDIIKERFLETELIMQLEALKQEMPESYLFPDEDPFDADIDTSMNIDGLLEDNTSVDVKPIKETKDVKKPKGSLLGELANEGVLESIAICAFIGYIMFAPDSF